MMDGPSLWECLLTRCECDLVINTLGAIIFELELQVL